MFTRFTPPDGENPSDTTLNIATLWLHAFNQQNWEALRAHLHPDIVFTQRTHSTIDRGIKDVFRSFHDWRIGHRELQGQILDGFGTPMQAALEVRWVGTKTDGEAVDFYACLLFKTSEGKLIEITDYY